MGEENPICEIDCDERDGGKNAVKRCRDVVY